MDVEKILAQLVRIGTVTSADPVKRVARVKFQDTGMTSGLLHVLASRPYIPDINWQEAAATPPTSGTSTIWKSSPGCPR